jgi:putative FmdB family regulatory protein
MPIYEYICADCRRRTSVLSRGYEPPESVVCESCGKAGARRRFTAPAVHRQESDRLAEFDTGKPTDSSFYNDSRNVGLWAKKRAQELGVDLGPKMDEIVEKARSGEILNDY